MRIGDIHYGHLFHDDVDEPNETTKESHRARDTTLPTIDFHLEVPQMMRDTSTMLRNRIHTLEREWDECHIENRIENTGRIENQIREATPMMCSAVH